ncbi:MAG: Two-component transcriptional response regulator, LuxR family [uncultured Gemmatimonadetes bacterium]|uniref:Two-component transcriptional response regulator, LuxR family n=1 Tax=uncultured Gemmatimonadota bacterium TaxID=203437 RepID=A0A6J4MAF3_9BACT|nr:MAG: Two-component transcriptional response regulator, LuxR family [uncultured Gemmatimonadota bacterium]
MTTVRIVLADDHEVVRAGMKAMLEASRGIEIVGEARDGEEAVAQAHRLTPDVVVMDLSMPVLDGAAATERLSRELPDVKVLVLTSFDDRGHLTRLLDAGAAGYVLKRAAADELVRAIRMVADGGTYVDPGLAGSLLRNARRAPGSFSIPTASLSEREEAVLRAIAWGQSNKEIAADLEISTKTVETYKARITDKLGLRTRTEMVRYALSRGWLAES